VYSLGAGLVVGSAGALGGGRLLGTMLYGVTPNDPSSYLFCGGAQLLVAIVAAVIPAVRAARADPLIAMRAD
jgi:ABC-type antimicrobial peptide transport system permease subunit